MKHLCFILLLSSMVFGQGVFVPPQQALKVVNGITSPLPNATVTVCAANASGIPCTPALAGAVFKDAALTQPLPNPFTADANGNYQFAILGGQYTVTVTGFGFAGYSYQISVGGGGSSSSVGQATGSVFTVGNTPCGGTPNCLQWVDDDATDNCGTATTTFLTSVNAYAGPGQPQLTIFGSSSGKAYKFVSCNLTFTIPVNIHLWATLDCAQATTNCIQFGVTKTNGTTGYAIAQTFKYGLDGGGSITGGASLTHGGIEIEPTIVNFYITGLNFINFGATNATLGQCTNYAILVDFAVAEGTISYNHWQVTDSSNGRCAVGNPNGFTTGSNTIFLVGNTFGGQSATNTTGCSSIAFNDGGSLGYIGANNFFAFGQAVRIAGVGTKIQGNNFDAFNCSASSVNAAVHVGATSSSTTVGPTEILNNTVQFGAGHTTNLLAQAGDSTATLTGFTLTNNVSTNGTAGTGIATGLTCITTTTFCFNHDNTNMTGALQCGTSSAGWQFFTIIAGCSNSAQAANLAATTLESSTVNANIVVSQGVSCEIILTQAATTSSTLPSCIISWTDLFTNTAQSVTVTPSWTNGGAGCSGTVTNTVGNSCQGSIHSIVPKAGTNVQYSTAGFASTGATGMQYQIFVRAFAE